MNANYKPNNVTIDASTFCQLRCPPCSSTRGVYERSLVGRGNLEVQDFTRFLDAHPHISAVDLANSGEMFLNPNLAEIIRVADERGVKLSASGGVNFNTASEEVLEELVRHQFAAISVSIDGASQETYSQYRIRGDFDRVIANIRKINGYKKRLGLKKPQLCWKFVVFPHNTHEIEKAEEMAAELGMSFWTTPDYQGSCQDYWEQHRKPHKRDGEGIHSFCKALFDHPFINWDGRLLGCCVNGTTDYGNAFESGLEACMRGEKYQYALAFVQGKADPRNDIMCSRCKIMECKILG